VTPPADILDALPHRPPFRFLTRVTALRHGESGDAIWCVDGSESFFVGHFPGNPIVPGLLVTEALAQLSGLVGFLRKDATPAATTGRLAHTDIRFKDAVAPPAELNLSSRLTRTFGALCQFEVEARCHTRVVARGRLTLAGSPVAAPERRVEDRE
jgi:3-hydroxyacyl-[acyl-carrier-protein] dehydratase